MKGEKTIEYRVAITLKDALLPNRNGTNDPEKKIGSEKSSYSDYLVNIRVESNERTVQRPASCSNNLMEGLE